MSESNDRHKIESWMRPDQVNLRKNARSYLGTAINLGVVPDDRILDIRAAGEGESSAVFKIETKGGNFIVKMSPEEGGVEAEATFLKAWHDQGIKVPNIHVIRSADSELPTSVLVMDYIEEPLLSKSMPTREMATSGTSRELGRILAKMHQAKGRGFGWPTKGTTEGEFQTFTEEMDDTFFTGKITWLLEQGVITEADVAAVRSAIGIIEDDLAQGIKPSLNHNDFRPYNVFNTTPITVFDPDPLVSHPAICLALTTLKPLVDKNSSMKEREQILLGYREISEVDDRVLAAATVLQGIRKLDTWQGKGRFKKVRLTQKVVRESAKLLS